ncbi:hypothetical protein [Capnocytophaga granulosa]|uniref:hypothetical protein n=1 Tax=Capnocytophaga granulosa TaxID=45242 RepID=UPI003C707738
MSNKKQLYIIAGCNGKKKTAMKKKEVKKDILKDKLLKGLSLSYKRMIAEKRKNNQKIVIKKGGIIAIITP